MRSILLILILLLASCRCSAQDYYDPNEATAVDTPTQPAHDHKSDKKPQRCHCPYQKSSSVWSDLWNDGVVGTGKAVYQSTVKPQVLGAVVGAVQQKANEAPIPSLIAQTGVAMGISQVQKARRHQRNRQIPRTGEACNCDPCAYHPPRYKSSK